MFVSTRTVNRVLSALRSGDGSAPDGEFTDRCLPAVYYLFTLTVWVNYSLKLAISVPVMTEDDKRPSTGGGSVFLCSQQRGGKTEQRGKGHYTKPRAKNVEIKGVCFISEG